MRVHCRVPILLHAALLASAFGAPAVSMRSLLDEMADLAALAEFPAPFFTCRQFSSYDRASQAPDADWFANADCGNYLRVEERAGRKEYVLMDAEGPGAIVRIWSANPKGTLRIYLDHESEPALEVRMADLLSGKVPGVPPPIAHTAASGWNCYLPIPYARHCLVTSDEGGFYYHVNYRTYPSDTRVETFRCSQLERLAPEIYRVAARLAFAGSLGKPAPGSQPRQVAFERALNPGEREVVELTGPAAISELTVRLALAQDNATSRMEDRAAALRQTVLRLTFDGELTAEVPVGDFFGAAPGVNPYDSLPMGVSSDGQMWSHWIMPFARQARLEIVNLGSRSVQVEGSLVHGSYTWGERSMHFWACWRESRDVPTRPMQDWNYADITGTGVFVGAAFTIANPVKAWWGEGDEKIYVDGEEFPSHFGTGTEDYYGYAWASPERFSHAYHNQPRCDGPGNYGHTAINRWHILDRIPFQKSLRFDMELWHWWEGVVPAMSVVTYWYARPGATASRQVLAVELPPPVLLAPYVAKRVEAALEGEDLRVIEHAGRVGPQELDGCSNDQQLWWQDARPGQRLVLGFVPAQKGRYRVYARCVRAPDYAIVRLAVNDQVAIEALDLYAERVSPAQELVLGEFELAAGENRLAIEILGANEKALCKYMFGLDYLRLEPAP